MKAPSVKLPLLHRGKAGEPPGIVAVARVDQRTKNITKRLSPARSPSSTTSTWTG